MAAIAMTGVWTGACHDETFPLLNISRSLVFGSAYDVMHSLIQQLSVSSENNSHNISINIKKTEAKVFPAE